MHIQGMSDDVWFELDALLSVAKRLLDALRAVDMKGCASIPSSFIPLALRAEIENH